MKRFAALLVIFAAALASSALAQALAWTTSTGQLLSLTSDKRIYSPQTMTAALGEVAARQISMTFNEGAYIIACNSFTYLGIDGNSILLQQESRLLSSSSSSALQKIAQAVIDDQVNGYTFLRVACSLPPGVTSFNTLHIPRDWKTAPLALNGLKAAISVLPDYRLKVELSQ